jgi:hypothetical protein
MHLSCICASEFEIRSSAPEARRPMKAPAANNWRLSSEQAGGTECSFVCHDCHVPRPYYPELPLPAPGFFPRDLG